jgi:ribosome biogenesis protein Nip4
MSLELAKPAEWRDIRKQIDSDFGIGAAEHLRKNLLLVKIEENSKQSYYLVSPEWESILESDLDTYKPEFGGIWLGDMQEGEFRIGLHVLDELSEITQSKVIVSDVGAESFTYGRSILKESVITIGVGLERGQKVIILSNMGDSLGFAKLTIDSSRIDLLSDESLVAKNLADIGWYIRKYTQ